MSIDQLKTAARYEVIGDVSKLMIPLYEQDRNFQVSILASCTCLDLDNNFTIKKAAFLYGCDYKVWLRRYGQPRNQFIGSL